MKMRRVIFNT